MSALNYDANKLPLGKLSKGTIARGFQALKELSVLLDNTDAASRAEVERLSNHYFSVIPHAFGRQRPPVIRDNTALKREIELLDDLAAGPVCAEEILGSKLVLVLGEIITDVGDDDTILLSER